MKDYLNLFQKCIEVVLRNEGGYVWHSSDPGGETNMGIAKKFYPNLDIKNLTKEQAIDIYYNDYWIPSRVEKLTNDDLILQVFDHGVNAGVKTSVKLLQRLIGETDDGIIGGKTVKAVQEYNGDVVDEFIKRRKLFYITLVQNKPELRIFMKGWLKRIEQTHF